MKYESEMEREMKINTINKPQSSRYIQVHIEREIKLHLHISCTIWQQKK